MGPRVSDLRAESVLAVAMAIVVFSTPIAAAGRQVVVNGGEIAVAGGEVRFPALYVTGSASSGGVVLSAGGSLEPAAGAEIRVGDGVVPGRFKAYGAVPPKVAPAQPGLEFFSFVVKSGATFDVAALDVRSLGSTGITLEAGSVLANGELSGVSFDDPEPVVWPASAAYVRFLHSSGSFAVKNCQFLNTPDTPVYNISTPPGSALQIDATQGNTGVLAQAVFENDHGMGHDSAPTTSRISWAASGAVALSEGWNLVAWPIPPPSAPFYASALAAQINDQFGASVVGAVKTLDQALAWPSSNFEVKLGEAYFVNVSAPGLWSPRGAPDPVTSQTWTFGPANGWYSLGVPFGSYTAETLAGALEGDLGASGNVTHIRWWNGTEWETHPVNKPFGDFMIEPVRGYAVKLTGLSSPTTVSLP